MEIGVTGAAGLIGSALARALTAKGHLVRGFDLRARAEAGDVRDAERVRAWAAGCDGVVHLAAVSRVVWGERDPVRCVETNEGGTRNVVEAALAAKRRPWVLVASSREVYGEPKALPVRDDDPLEPVNVYGRTKASTERIALEGRARGLRAAVLRFSNVYGSVDDHADRVVPAFCRGAALGERLRVDGASHTFDFTHLDDTVAGICATVSALAGGEDALPPMHLVSGRPTTLGQLASLASAAGGRGSEVYEAPSRSFDVSRFVGDPRRAQALLGWRARRTIEEGVASLVGDFAALRGVALSHRGDVAPALDAP